MNEIIKVENLKKSYGNAVIVNDLNISIRKGEVYGLLGANGAGKSTTIECILGTRKADNGKISILGLNPIDNRKKLFQHISVQFQEATYQEKIFVSELCEETSCLYKRPKDYILLLKQFGLFEKLKSPVSELSGGQKQKLFIILALIPNPQVVFLDELTTGLDTMARRDIWTALLELKKEGLTIFLTSHFMDEVEALCDRIMILKNGVTIFEGTVKEAITHSPCNNFEDTYIWYAEEENNHENI